MNAKLLTTGAALALAVLAIYSQESTEDLMQRRQSFERQTTNTLKANYLLYLPKDYPGTGKRWPLILFLHGAGERGSDLAKVAVHGPPKLVKQKKEFPFIIVSPQCPAEGVWSNEVLLGLLDAIVEKYAVDTNRVYLTGLSMGGFGTWSLGVQHPERFAAIAPICGGGDVIHALLAGRRQGSALKTLGVWAFHGAKDPVVPVTESERMLAALKKAGVSDLQLTVHPEAEHDSWTQTYENPKLYEWFLAHARTAGR